MAGSCSSRVWKTWEAICSSCGPEVRPSTPWTRPLPICSPRSPTNQTCLTTGTLSVLTRFDTLYSIFFFEKDATPTFCLIHEQISLMIKFGSHCLKKKKWWSIILHCIFDTNREFPLWINKLVKLYFQIKVSIYKHGVEKAYIVFDARNSDKLNWFTSDRIIDSSWGNITSIPKQFIGMQT